MLFRSIGRLDDGSLIAWGTSATGANVLDIPDLPFGMTWSEIDANCNSVVWSRSRLEERGTDIGSVRVPAAVPAPTPATPPSTRSATSLIQAAGRVSSHRPDLSARLEAPWFAGRYPGQTSSAAS